MDLCVHSCVLTLHNCEPKLPIFLSDTSLTQRRRLILTSELFVSGVGVVSRQLSCEFKPNQSLINQKKINNVFEFLWRKLAAFPFIRSCSSPISSCFTSNTPEWRYDVFLSFRGLDTRNNFSDHLYDGLVERGITVFRDDKKLGKGKAIIETIFEAIKMSRFSIVIFSRNYAFSEWCLDELVKIIGCMNEKGHVAFPVFYHVTPDDVMNQMGRFKEAFLHHQQFFEKERIQMWRSALTKIAGICGWDVQNYRSESKLVKSIVEKISRNLRCASQSICKQLVPLNTTIKEVNLYLYEGLENVDIVRICGIDGMGSTTIARVVYDTIFNNKLELLRFQELVSEMPKESRRNLWDADEVISVIKKKLQHKKVLVLLDDVDTLELVASLVRRHGWFVPGSRIVISTRTPDKMILNVLEMGFHKPEDRVIMHDMNFDESENEGSSIFLDIACFFKEIMNDEHATRIMRSLVTDDLQAKSGMKVLINKMSINISDIKNLLNYDFLQDLNWENFFQKNLEEHRSHNKSMDMVSIDRLVRDGLGSISSQSTWKTENEPREGLVAIKSGNEQQSQVGNGAQGKYTGSQHNLASVSVKVRENEVCCVSSVLRSTDISETSALDNAAKSLSVLSFLEELANAIAFNANSDVETKSLLISEKNLQQNLNLKITNSAYYTRQLMNGEKKFFPPKSPATISDDFANERNIVVSSTNCSMKESSDSGMPDNIEAINQRQKDASFLYSESGLRSSKTNDQQLQFFMPESSSGRKIVRIPKVVAEVGIKQWDLCLVGQLLEESVEISQMINMANKQWGEEGRIEVTKTENELYIFKFPNERSRDLVLESGPWFIANNPLVMRRWQPKMQLSELDKSKIPVWVKLKGIPMEYMTVQGLSYIASALGKPLYMDRATASKSRLTFPKVCVQMSIEDEIVEYIPVMDDDGVEFIVKVQYLWKPEKCISCREFGHSLSKCPYFNN